MRGKEANLRQSGNVCLAVIPFPSPLTLSLGEREQLWPPRIEQSFVIRAWSLVIPRASAAIRFRQQRDRMRQPHIHTLPLRPIDDMQ